MRWADAIALAARGVSRRRGRAALTVLAVALAAALLTALLMIAGTARTRVLDQLAKGGPLAGITVAAAEPDPGELDRDNAQPGPPKDLDDDAVRRIRALPDVRTVVPVVATRVLVLPPAGDDFRESMVGVDLRRAGLLPITVLAGRLPVHGARGEVAVGPTYLERVGLTRERATEVLGTEVQLGAPRAFPDGDGITVRGRWVRARVVGVVAQEAADGDVLATFDAVREAREWTAAGGDVGRFEVPSSPYSGLFVVARDLDRVPAARRAITDVGYATRAPENLIASVQRYLRVVEIVLSGIGLIALVIASLGIANALLAAVRERRREIGVLKAIGARDRDVRRVFLVEASVLGLVGGMIGTILGWAVARTVGSVVNRYLTDQGLAGVAVELPVPLLAGGVLGSGILALAAGTFPAVRAARMPARQAIGDV